ncbi:MAG: CPBP family intramembrane metalloprotease [Actinobacteria bacterium]|nr:CPBP family intramembrane metalloprotease [Actinomycetota bacterium]
MSEPSRKTVVTAIGVYNLVQNLLIPAPAYVPTNLTATCGLVVLARRQGCSWDDLGLDISRAGMGLRLGLAGAGLATTVALAAGAHPVTRRYLLDQRAAGQQSRDVAYRALVRFPLGTALFEEVAFRGVVHGVWRLSGASQAGAAVASSVTFAIWHLIPASQALVGNPLASRLDSRRSRVAVVLAGAVVAGLAGLGFTWMRERSGSLIAPWMTHAAINCAGYLVGVAAWRRSAKHSSITPPAPDGVTKEEDGRNHG